MIHFHTFGLGQEQNDQHPKNQAPRRIPAKGTLSLERRQHGWEAEGQNEIEGPESCRRPGHPHISHVRREGFGRVREGHRAHSGRVEAFEEVHARNDHRHPRRAVRLLRPSRRRIDEEGHARPQEADGQKGECEDHERSPSELVDGEEGRQSEHPVEDPGTHRGQQSRVQTVAAVQEDVGGVVSDHVHPTELLPEHDDPGRLDR